MNPNQKMAAGLPPHTGDAVAARRLAELEVGLEAAKRRFAEVAERLEGYVGFEREGPVLDHVALRLSDRGQAGPEELDRALLRLVAIRSVRREHGQILQALHERIVGPAQRALAIFRREGAQ